MSSKMKIKILQKGGEKHHTIVDDAIRFYASELMSTRMANTLSIRCEIRNNHFVGEKHTGIARNDVNGSKVSKEFMIAVKRDMPLGEQLEVLAHEMVHVMQYATNKLQFKYKKTTNRVHCRWMGNDLGHKDLIPYHQRPWEVEAYGLQRDMLKKFFEVVLKPKYNATMRIG